MTKRGWVLGLGALIAVACSGSVDRNPAGVASGGMADATAGEAPEGGQAGTPATGGLTGSAGAEGGGASAVGGQQPGRGGADPSAPSASGGAGGDDGSTDVAAGDCAKPGQLRCDGRCIDPSSDRRHCGACRRTCGATYACVDGECGCAGDEVECEGSCVDVASDGQHCGDCETRCGATEICKNGACACPDGQRECGGSCIDVSTDADHCGACGKECAIQQACAGGHCVVSAGGERGPDGCAGLAGDVALTDVWAYQSVEIPIMKDGAEVTPAGRVAPIVAGKALMLRLFPRRAQSSTRLLSGRVLVQNGSSSDVYFEKKSLWSSPSPTSLDTTFQVAIPANKVTTSTRFIAEVVDCGQPVASASSARYSGSDGTGAALGAIEMPTLKVRILPLQVNGLLPDTSTGALDVYRTAAIAMWPFSQIDLKVGATLSVADAYDWPGMLDKVRARREADAPANDVYYYGIVKPSTTVAEYCAGQTSCTAGLGFLVSDSASSPALLRASVGLGFADRQSAETMLHELGHNHGRLHAPCGVTDTTSIDLKFPSYSGSIGGRGWDERQSALIGSATGDLMGYCAPRWVGLYTYGGVLARALSVGGAAKAFKSQSVVGKWRVLLADARGLRWGVPFTRPAPAYGEPEPATIRDALGRELGTVVVYRSPIADADSASLLVPEPQPGWHSLELAGSSSALPFEP